MEDRGRTFHNSQMTTSKTRGRPVNEARFTFQTIGQASLELQLSYRKTMVLKLKLHPSLPVSLYAVPKAICFIPIAKFQNTDYTPLRDAQSRSLQKFRLSKVRKTPRQATCTNDYTYPTTFLLPDSQKQRTCTLPERKGCKVFIGSTQQARHLNWHLR